MASGVGTVGLALIGLWGATTAMAAAPKTSAIPVACSATGTKLVAPPMAAADLCRHFVRALGDVMHVPTTLVAELPAEGLIVELRFLPQGVASARATRLNAGQRHVLPLYELAVSDRGFAPRDIETLAASVAQGMTTIGKTKGQ